MHIAISALSLEPGRIGGAEFMIRNLVHGLAQLEELKLTVIAPRGVTGWPAAATIKRPSVGMNRFVGESTIVPLWAKQMHADALILPNYFTPPALLHVPTTTVIHDTLFRSIPGVFRAEKRAWLRACHRLTMARASRVVTISTSVADELRHVYGDDERIVTIPNPIDWSRFDGAQGPPPLAGRPYVLSVAAEWPHKNIATLVKAFHRVKARLGGCALVLVGQTRDGLRGRTTSDTPSLAELVAGRCLEHDVFQTGHVSDAELGDLYRHARGFVFPSLFEGFGMPPVEALGMGLPVVTTRCGAIPEATRYLGHYVKDAMDHEELGRALVTLSHEPERLAPSAADVLALRTFYAPARIAALYRDVVLH